MSIFANILRSFKPRVALYPARFNEVDVASGDWVTTNRTVTILTKPGRRVLRVPLAIWVDDDTRGEVRLMLGGTVGGAVRVKGTTPMPFVASLSGGALNGGGEHDVRIQMRVTGGEGSVYAKALSVAEVQ